MKIKLISVIFLLFVCHSVFSQTIPLLLIFSKTIDGNSALSYAVGPYTGSSPHGFSIIDGKFFWVAQNSDGIILESFSGEIIHKVPYPTSDLYAAFQNGNSYLFSNNWSASINSPVITQYTNDYSSILTFKHYREIKLLWSRPYIINDRAFFFRVDGKLISFIKDGSFTDVSATTAILLDWANKSVSTNAELIKNGLYLIVDGIFYPASCSQIVNYFKKLGNQFSESEHFRRILGDSPPEGMSYNGDMYVRLEDGIYVYAQDGSLQAKIDTSIADPNQQPNSREEISEFLTAVHPNGDLYAMYARKDDKAYFYRATKTWGIDYIALSKKGINAQDLNNPEGIVVTIKRMNSHEIRIVKNAFFALQGYDFQSWELKCFFNGYDWYKPDPKVKSDIASLTENQKRLYDLVVAEETRRK